ncbi:MAG TPA: hypothetical protein VI094_24155 [Propionibacteriaceae bacterium]
MSERSVYDLDRIRANPFNVGATNGDLVSRALHGADVFDALPVVWGAAGVTDNTSTIRTTPREG